MIFVGNWQNPCLKPSRLRQYSLDTPGIEFLSKFSSVFQNDKKTKEDYKFLIENDKLVLLDKKRRKTKSLKEEFGEDLDLEKMQKILTSKFNPVSATINAVFKKKDFSFDEMVPKELLQYKIERYDEDVQGLLGFAKNLKRDGFKFNEEEVDMWLGYADDYADYLDDGSELEFVKIKEELKNILSEGQTLKLK